MGRKPSIFSPTRMLFGGSSFMPLDDMQGNSSSQGSTPEARNSFSNYSKLPIETRRQRIQDALDSRKKRKRALFDGDSSSHVNCIQADLLSQETTPEATNSVSSSSTLLNQTSPQQTEKKKIK